MFECSTASTTKNANFHFHSPNEKKNIQQYAQFCTLNNNENGNFDTTVFTKLILVPKKERKKNINERI